MNSREKLMKARAEIAAIRGIPEAEVSGWEAGFLAWGYEDEKVEPVLGADALPPDGAS